MLALPIVGLPMSDALSSRVDHCTRSNVDEVVLTHLSLTLDVDFEHKVLTGCASWTATVLAPTTKLILDTKALAVERVTVDGEPAKFAFGDAHEAFGTALTISLPEGLAKGAKLSVAVHYATSPESSALQWLPKECTAGKKLPYLFSQCQAIHARALIPCADTPSTKFAYDANVTSPEWATVLMSAVSSGSKRKGGPEGGATSFTFEQTTPIPSYLLAVAVGQLEARTVGPRSQVWSEPSMVEAVAYEFAETETFVAAAEQITGHAYVWGRYDILCLPPSFPYGGMENPCLTFVTPTLLAGDRSLADVVAHEVSHSWTGNLITNHTWEHFWLNEGWTVWLERKIKAHMKGAAHYDFGAISGVKHLADDVALYGASHPLTHMVPQLRDVDPDDAFSSVPYEKGFNLLHYLSTLVGGAEAFEEFARAYVDHFKFKTLTSADFRTFFMEWCRAREVDASAVDWDAWLVQPGMPPVTNSFSNSLGAACSALGDRWLAPASEGAPKETIGGARPADVEGWSSGQLIALLEHMLEQVGDADAVPPPPLASRLASLDALYKLSASRNAEVRFRWQRLCIKMRAGFIVPQVVDFLKSQGRMKFTRPLFRDLFAWPEQKHVAVETFTAWAENYHPICRQMVSKDLGLTK